MRGVVIGDRFKVLEQVGEGGSGQGEVYRAVELTTGRDVAVKVQLPRLFEDSSEYKDNGEDMEREGKRSGLLAGDGIPEVFWKGSHGSRYCIVMEYLEGPTLAEALAQCRPVKVPTAAAVVAQLCRILGRVHGEKLVHRDIKPTNVMIVGESGRVHLLDLGWAARAGCVPERTGGTGGWMAPEQFDPRAVVTPAFDIFALGCLLLHMTVLTLPYGSTASSRPQEGAPVLPADRLAALPSELKDLVLAMVAWAPGDRPASAQEVFRSLAPLVPVPGSQAPGRALKPDPTAYYRLTGRYR
ncbi:serine/threonine-protein kinase [Streptomyces sp. NPDC006529]|uniref:serine/threonine-protein kinase n=1 Tax=Streptomyces sp. NPDC006529 TaxID=3157177 RepID=UPI0033B10D50